MLSRLNHKAGSQGLLKCIKQCQVPAACTATSPVNQNQSSQRDLVNFPRPVRMETSPETRFGFVPKSWFDFLYPKTGVTGPYMLLTGLGTYIFSKEIIVVGPEFSLFVASVCVVTFLHMKFSPQLKEMGQKLQDEEVELLDSQQSNKKKYLAEGIELSKEAKWQSEGVTELLPEAKRENVYLQLEAAYRARMNEAFVKVKKHLDYQVEKQNVERRIAQRNMVDYVIRNVEASISSQLKSNALKQCISDLKSMSTKA